MFNGFYKEGMEAMMQTMKLIGDALAVGLALSAQAATNDDVLLYCVFDGSATATFVRGPAWANQGQT